MSAEMPTTATPSGGGTTSSVAPSASTTSTTTTSDSTTSASAPDSSSEASVGMGTGSGADAPNETIVSDGGEGKASLAPSTVAAKNEEDPYAPLVSFDWDSWDGQDYSAFGDRADKLKPVLEKFSAYRSNIEKQLQAAYAERANELKQYYIDVMGGNVTIDPGEYREAKAAIDRLTAESQKIISEYAELQSKYAEYETAVRQREEQRYQKWAENFRTRTQDVWSDEKKATTFKEALESGFRISGALALARGDGKLAAKAIALAKEKVPPEKAVEFAKLELAKAPAPNTAAKLIDGAERVHTPNTFESTVDVSKLPPNQRLNAKLDEALARRGFK